MGDEKDPLSGTREFSDAAIDRIIEAVRGKGAPVEIERERVREAITRAFGDYDFFELIEAGPAAKRTAKRIANALADLANALNRLDAALRPFSPEPFRSELVEAFEKWASSREPGAQNGAKVLPSVSVARDDEGALITFGAADFAALFIRGIEVAKDAVSLRLRSGEVELPSLQADRNVFLLGLWLPQAYEQATGATYTLGPADTPSPGMRFVKAASGEAGRHFSFDAILKYRTRAKATGQLDRLNKD